MTAARLFGLLPWPGKIMFSCFAAIPLLSIYSGEISASLLAHPDLRLGLALTGSVIVPTLLCLSMLFFHYMFIPLYFMECGSVFLNSSLYPAAVPEELLMLRYMFLLMMTITGFLIGHREFLYPMMTRDQRTWRRAERVPVNFQVSLQVGPLGQELIPSLMQNCSNTGLALLVSNKHLSTRMVSKEIGDRIVTHCTWDNRPHEILGKIVRFSDGENYRVYGIEVDDIHTMKAYVAWAKQHIGYLSKPVPAALQIDQPAAWHYLSVAFWAISIALSFGFSIFGTMFQ